MSSLKSAKFRHRICSLMLIFALFSTILVFRTVPSNANENIININGSQVKVSVVTPDKCIFTDEKGSLVVEKISNNKIELTDTSTGEKNYFLRTEKGIYSSITNETITYEELNIDHSLQSVTKASATKTVRVSYATIKKGCGNISRVTAIAGFIAAIVGAPALAGAILGASSLYSDVVGQTMKGSPRHGI